MLGIYIHIPFCQSKCIYCDFYSITDLTLRTQFIEALIKDIHHKGKLFKSNKFDTIFFGGGTPSLLSLKEFEQICEALFCSFNIYSDSEITIEANPGTLDSVNLNELKRLPVNRISFGIQSFINSELKSLSRIHNSNEAVNTVKLAQDAGFTNINIDLMFALPGQDTNNWQFSLETAVRLDVQHISAYSLIYEDGTFMKELLTKKKISPVLEATENNMYLFAIDFLSAHGYNQYEVSNFAKEGFRCRHNLKYWQHEEYIGFGPSAASFTGNIRSVNVRDAGDYIRRINTNEKTTDFEEYIDADKSMAEFIFLGLRSRGVEFSTFKKKYSVDFRNRYDSVLKLLSDKGLGKITDDSLSLTPKGYALCDEIISSYF